MNSLDPAFLDRQSITRQLVSTVREIGVLRRREELYRQQSPQVLETLRQVVIQSTKSSNRIGGGGAAPRRIREIVPEKATPANRSEEEIAGHRDVLSTIHANYSDMRLTSGLVRQLHRDLYQFTPQPGGDWKTADNEIIERHPDGTVRTRFRPTPALQTADAMESLPDRLRPFWEAHVSSITGGAAPPPSGPEAYMAELTMGQTIPDLVDWICRQPDETYRVSPSLRLPKGATREGPHE